VKWHLIDKFSGKILRTVDVVSRKEAEAILDNGMVVSAASWRLDVHKFKPVETVVTELVQDQKQREPLYRHEKGYKTVRELAREFGVGENKIRHLADNNRITYEIQKFGSRRIKFFPPYACKQIKRLLNKNSPARLMRESVVKSFKNAGLTPPPFKGAIEI